MSKNINAYWIKRAIGGIDQSYLFVQNRLDYIEFNARPDPNYMNTISFFTGLVGYLKYNLDTATNLVDIIFVPGPPFEDETSEIYNTYDAVIIKEGQNNANGIDYGFSEYISVVKLFAGLVIGVNEWALHEELSAGDRVSIHDGNGAPGERGKWKVADPGELVIGDVIGIDANGLTLIHLRSAYIMS